MRLASATHAGRSGADRSLNPFSPLNACASPANGVPAKPANGLPVLPTAPGWVNSCSMDTSMSGGSGASPRPSSRPPPSLSPTPPCSPAILPSRARPPARIFWFLRSLRSRAASLIASLEQISLHMLTHGHRLLTKPALRPRPWQVPRCRAAFASEAGEHDVVVIGAGPGGYVAAIKAAQLGLKTACVDKRGLPGGTCLNVGCIPSKSLLNNTAIYHQIQHDIKQRGIEVGEVKLNLEQMMRAKDTSVTSLTRGIEMLFKKNKVEYIKGSAKLVGEHEVEVVAADGGQNQTLRAKNIIIATGSEATPFPGLDLDEKRIVTSTGAIALKEVPKRMVVIGGGIIGLELGSVWARLGSEVTVVEFLASIGPGMDADMSKSMLKILQRQGMKFKLNTKVLGGQVDGETVKIDVEAAKGGKKETLEADICLVAIGRRAYTTGLGLENVGLEMDEKGRIVIDQEYRTKIPHIRVVGDCTFGAMLAHKAEEEGIAAAEYIKSGHGHVNYNAIPSVMYTHPEAAWVGMTEEQVKKSGASYATGVFPFAANSRAKTNLDTDGQVKFISDKETDRVLGVHIIGPNAGEMISEAVLAIEYGASSEDIARTSHAHPTLSEAFKEAAMATYSKAIHF